MSGDVKTTTDTRKASTKVSKTEFGEYRVRLFIDGVYQAGADYFAGDRAEAKATAELMESRAVESDKTTDFAKSEAADYAEECGMDAEPETVLYDVCNDYTLDARETEPADIAEMEATKTAEVALYQGTLYWNEHGELVYFRGEPGLNSKEI